MSLPKSEIKAVPPGYYASTFLSKMPQYIAYGRIFASAALSLSTEVNRPCHGFRRHLDK